MGRGKRHIALTLGAIVIAGLLAATGCSESTSGGVTQSDVDQVEEELTGTTTALEEANDEIEDLEGEIERLETELHNAKAPYETPEDDSYLDETEWQEGLAAARLLLGREKIAPRHFFIFVNELSKQDGIYWSGIEQTQFQQRYRAWYRERYGY